MRFACHDMLVGSGCIRKWSRGTKEQREVLEFACKFTYGIKFSENHRINFGIYTRSFHKKHYFTCQPLLFGSNFIFLPCLEVELFHFEETITKFSITCCVGCINTKLVLSPKKVSLECPFYEKY